MENAPEERTSGSPYRDRATTAKDAAARPRWTDDVAAALAIAIIFASSAARAIYGIVEEGELRGWGAAAFFVMLFSALFIGTTLMARRRYRAERSADEDER